VRPGDALIPADAYVYDISEGTGRGFDWSLAAGHPHAVILAGGLDGRTVGEAIRVAQPWGVDACSRLEAAPGIKDPAKVRHFVAAAIAAFTPEGGTQ
jgi:phosphoribosylanthranilate isomerase